MRVPQDSDGRGSLKWIQVAVNDATDVLNQMVIDSCRFSSQENITWLSPLRKDDFAEYRDQAFLDLLDIILPHRKLEEFWPKRGPQWDALGRTESGAILLVEAKANIPEVVSPGTQAGPGSRPLIEKSMREVQAFMGVDQAINWTGKLYQYTNRLAHLYLLRELNAIDAYLVNIYFTGDEDVGGPKTIEEWKSALTVVKGVLGIGNRHKLSRYIGEAFVEVSELIR